MTENIVRFERQSLRRTTPNRGAANFYRGASDNEQTVGGVAFDSVEAAVVSAVRMGYKIAAEQIERSERIAQRLRQAGDKAAGVHSDRQALDATEQLVFKTLMSGLGFLEGFANEPANPLKRLVSAEFQLLGSLFGLTRPGDGRAPSPHDPHAGTAPTPSYYSKSPEPNAPAVHPQIRHKGQRRAVQVVQWEIAPATAPGKYPIAFYSVQSPKGEIKGSLIMTPDKTPALTITIRQGTIPGTWRGAICHGELQIGYVEIVF